MLTYAQLPAAFDYELGVRMGRQESAARVTDVGVAYRWGFALADLVLHAPLLAAGLIGHLLEHARSRPALAVAFGITVYRPIVSPVAVHAARNVPGQTLLDTCDYPLVLPLVMLWGVRGLWQTIRPPP